MKKELKQMLIDEKVVKIRDKDEEPFILNELGTKSRIFFDIKEASLNPIILRKIINFIKPFDGMEKNLDFDAVGSVAVGGIPIASVYSYVTNIPQIIVRNCEHDRGTKSKIIGNCKNKKVLFIEDVSVTGNSIIKGVKSVRNDGGVCDTCIVVIDREEGAVKNCLDNGIDLIPLLKKSDFGITEEI